MFFSPFTTNQSIEGEGLRPRSRRARLVGVVARAQEAATPASPAGLAVIFPFEDARALAIEAGRPLVGVADVDQGAQPGRGEIEVHPDPPGGLPVRLGVLPPDPVEHRPLAAPDRRLAVEGG